MAESFGSDAERYDRARPAYPRELVDRIVAASAGTDVLDVGCGTGIEARQFRAAGCRVLGIDPDARMAGFARRSGLDVEVAKFEDWEPAGRTFDAVVAGQAWHWVDPVAGPAKAARVLRPGGLLAVFAHVFQPPAEVAEAFSAACRRVLPGLPFAAESRPAAEIYDVMFTGFADAIAKAAGFGAPDRWRFEWERTYTRDEWLDFLPTTGGLTRLPPAELAEVLTDVGAAVDELGGSFVLPYTTLAVVAHTA
ncbi:class I SAM-dependent methyltransferase [Amycolatopsis sp. cmx-4-61]|uniref:class I SAM-dependent methyltransferase n=1 Tax=Amycolatopsis sp. cmx-4-61 TaxID=2790937 RepID=UPI00397C1AAC